MEYLSKGWRKSSYSSGADSNCVEVAGRRGAILVRDTKQRGDGPVHRFTSAEWRAFTTGVRAGRPTPPEAVRPA
jgi:hypothetical protein